MHDYKLAIGTQVDRILETVGSDRPFLIIGILEGLLAHTLTKLPADEAEQILDNLRTYRNT